MFKFKTEPEHEELVIRAVDTYKLANPHRYNDPDGYIEILNDFFNQEIARRTELLIETEKNDWNMRSILTHISQREHLIDGIMDWGWTYDPRNATLGLPTLLPIIPFPRQIEFLEWLYEHYLRQKRGLVEKSRDAGATWFFILMMTHEWRWTEGFAGGIGSNKLDNVDQKDNPDCIFEKIRTYIKFMPPFWMPHGYDKRKHDKWGNLINPEMGSNIVGQGGPDIGRGGRRSIYLVDEAASLEFPLKVDAALSANTNCQMDLSTPKGMNHFGQKRHSGKVSVFTFHWKEDPRKDDQWHEEQLAVLDPVVVAQEIEVNYHASVEGLFIKPEWISAAVDLDLKPVGEKGSGLDVAAGGTNKSSLAIHYGPVALVQSFNIENGTDLAHTAIDLCNKALVDFFHYDKIGVGHAVYSTINRTERVIKFPHYPLDAGDPPSDIFYDELEKKAKDAFVNARAEWWYRMRRRFEKTFEHVNGIRKYDESELISIPNQGNLIAQLASPKMLITESGKIKCESKSQMMKRGIASPDEADAMVMAFLPKSGGRKQIIDSLGYMHMGSTQIDWSAPDFRNRHYGALVLNQDLSVNGLFAVWDEEKNFLSVYDEVSMEMINTDLLSSLLVRKMQMSKVRVDKLYGNKVMFEDFKRTFKKEMDAHFWRKIGSTQFMKIREASRYDPIGSASVLMNLAKMKRMMIDKRCKEAYRQFISWRLEKGKFEQTGMREAILMIISELMSYQPFKTKVMKIKEYSMRIGDSRKPKPETGDPMGV